MSKNKENSKNKKRMSETEELEARSGL